MSDNKLIEALKRMGYMKEEFVPHSFRAMFSTIAYENTNEHQCSGEVIDALLAHKETNKIKEDYNRTSKIKYFEEKKELMQWWAEWLDKNIL